jgi:hypothetical protein
MSDSNVIRYLQQIEDRIYILETFGSGEQDIGTYMMQVLKRKQETVQKIICDNLLDLLRTIVSAENENND